MSPSKSDNAEFDSSGSVDGTRAKLQDRKSDAVNASISRIHKARVGQSIQTFTGEKRTQKQKTEVEVIAQYQTRKEELRDLAYDQLREKLKERTVVCPRCLGDGAGCRTCGGDGVITQDVDMRAIELVLKPDFPKTSISVHASIDAMKPQELIGMLQNMLSSGKKQN